MNRLWKRTDFIQAPLEGIFLEPPDSNSFTRLGCWRKEPDSGGFTEAQEKYWAELSAQEVETFCRKGRR